ncbi:MAG: phosphohydrolase [Candidatus Omnitrophica bacterium]|nr:phosphohydrolase [Candidatus Omnitrophota bacterium]
MIRDKCPGQDERNIKPGNLKCPNCGYAVEIFSDELKRRCPKCKKLVYQEKLPTCTDWCKSAQECIQNRR